ncbi:16S rRNA (cytidine(1402)-2'-O)-methyltransferase [Hydromonas duriensis]|uniref:Ribosomal RNA small subunit methyltransferase I n=1 Tax=Hydromonas duriensis TaxID=1527608 RepID=A0A4R6Y7F2_9BURK|nr:16S rRNA (cytidine(1402)-2'-O)-methyltransferase [Hydromonas duriensis]TDR31260.1 16S rRNA (cytidine1402-2'-O)-methyltransferase [Hydromonas duriensis]
MTDFNPSTLSSLWQNAHTQQWPQGTLYVVATPIGNVADISIRALYALQLVDAIACEDTRHSKPLLAQYGISKPLIAVHDHNESDVAASLIARLQLGERIALITDAGTPAISDPGSRVVAAAHEAGIRVMPIAGASAAVAAMSAAGLDGGFQFIGFLPNKSAARLSTLQRLGSAQTHLVFYEAPHRLHDTITDMARSFPSRCLILAKELSKLHENIQILDLSAIDSWLANAPAPRGEYVLILSAPAVEVSDSVPEWHNTLTTLLTELPLKQAVALTVKLSGASKNTVYATALSLKL